MEEFLKTYLCLCRDRGMEPQESVVAHLQESRGVQGFKLNLSGLSLSLESCCVLGQALQCDKTFTEVSLNDCMLSEEGATALLNGLFNNTTVKVLELKGNNLRFKGAEVLGKFLTCNKTLCRLVLEWNSLGMWDEAFSHFCQGLASNRGLTHLDLRNNQINHHGASELAVALKCNSNVQVLDLRWNNIGLLGGRSLLEALQNNTSLVQLEIAGNNIPSDTLRALELARSHNSAKQSILSENHRRVQILTKEIYATKAEGTYQLLGLKETIDRQREEMSLSSRSTSIQIGQLKDTLNERKCTFSSLTAKLHMTEAALALSEEKNRNVAELLAQLQMEIEEQREQQIRKENKEQKENVLREDKLLREIHHLTEINIQLRNKVKVMEHKCKCQQQQIFGLKQESVNNSAELKLHLAQAEEQLESEKQRFKQVLEDKDILHQKKVEQVQQHLEDSVKTLQEQIFKLEAQKTQLEEQVSKAKAAFVMEQVRTEEELGRVRAEVILEEQAHVSSLEDKLHSVLTSQRELQLLSCQQRRTISDLRFKTNQLSTESEGLQSKIEELEQELACKDQEKLADVSQVKAELKDQIGHLHAERTALREKINDLDREIKVLSNNHREVLLDKESEMTSAMEKLRLKEKEIQRMREDEACRASHLQSAIFAYFQGSSLEQYRSPKK